MKHQLIAVTVAVVGFIGSTGCATQVGATENAVVAQPIQNLPASDYGAPTPTRSVIVADVSPTCVAGEVRLWSGGYVGGLPAQGQVLPALANQQLATAIGNKFGGQAGSTIALPDLRQAAPVEWTTYAVCDMDGYESTNNGFVGQLRLFAGPMPTGVLPANGQSVSNSQYRDLSVLLGNRFGSVDSDHFNLPDLSAPADGLAYGIVATGQWPYFGSESNMLTLTSEVLFFAVPVNDSNGGLGALPANGQQLPTETSEALYYLIGNYFGGQAPSTFALPNLNSVAAPNTGYYINQNGNFPAQRQ